jgi:hypothetical protein
MFYIEISIWASHRIIVFQFTGQDIFLQANHLDRLFNPLASLLNSNWGVFRRNKAACVFTWLFT